MEEDFELRREGSFSNIFWGKKKSDFPKVLILREVHVLFLLFWFIRWYLLRTHVGVGVSEPTPSCILNVFAVNMDY